jgi:hypothetical protein
VTFNFGPDFKHAPPRVEGWPEARPVSELAGPPPAGAEPGAEPDAAAAAPGAAEPTAAPMALG